MRILIWTDAFWPEIGGMEVFLMRLVTELQRRGHACEIVTGRRGELGPDFDHYLGVPVHRFDFESALMTRNLSEARTIVEECNRVIDNFRPDPLEKHFLLCSSSKNRAPARTADAAR
jgi:hypothetical protein